MNYNQFKNNLNTFNSIISGEVIERENDDVEIEGNVEILFIQGDTFYKEMIVEDLHPDRIENIYFTCEDLNLCKPCIRSNNIFVLEFDSEETKDLKPYLGTYDLTLKLTTSEVITIGHNFPFIILDKKNEVNCNE